MIIRENARLFFLSALSSNAKCEDVLRPSDFDFRLARKSDIKSIRHCNLETLPENYSTDFYDTHIKDWPELALVAEHADRRRNEDQPPQVVGYVLGRIEVNKDSANSNTNTNMALPGWSCRTPKSRGGVGGAMVIPPSTGHVTSLAVLPGFRRCGAASQLMDMLHQRMNYHYKANKVSLHVRKSNRGAIRLYEELLGYKVAGVASSYYSDGEDAFVMEAQLPEVDSQPAGNIRGASALALPRSLDVSSTTVRHASSRESAGFVTTAAAANSSSSSGSGSGSGSSKGGLVTSASASGAGADPHRVYSRNNVGFVTAAAAAAAAAVATGATAAAPTTTTAAAPLPTTTPAAATPPTPAAAAAAPPLVLQAVVSTPRTPGGGGGGDGGGSRNCGLDRRGYGTMSGSRGVQHPCGDGGGGTAATA